MHRSPVMFEDFHSHVCSAFVKLHFKSTVRHCLSLCIVSQDCDHPTTTHPGRNRHCQAQRPHCRPTVFNKIYTGIPNQMIHGKIDQSETCFLLRVFSFSFRFCFPSLLFPNVCSGEKAVSFHQRGRCSKHSPVLRFQTPQKFHCFLFSRFF